ncbi:pentapeptide repeat-containing protein [Pseudidiomarina salilacus]|uniref:pentapeptide repeat-containing protein n=1 Tax=Pseudidiomarina salilacus TaxID=3384452 RepID=UPI0039854F5D
MTTLNSLLYDPWIISILATVVVAFLGYITKVLIVEYQRKITKSQVVVIGQHFREIVQTLASGNSEQRLSSAILLRRFFDPKSEYGLDKTPYAKDCLGVISSFLKILPNSEVQKALADNLKYAEGDLLHGADLQHTNLSNAYLGSSPDEAIVSIVKADFFRARLIGMSLRRADLSNATFYEADLNRTVLRDTTLKGANFNGATLYDVDFRGADLRGATFLNATVEKCRFMGASLDDNVFKGSFGKGNLFDDDCDSSKEIQLLSQPETKKVFISKPGCLDAVQEHVLQRVRSLLESLGAEPIELNRADYDSNNVISNLEKKLEPCEAMIVLGFKVAHIKNGSYRAGTQDYRELKDEFLATPWNNIEAGMMLARKKRIFLLHEKGIEEGLFHESVNDILMTKVELSDSLSGYEIDLKTWLAHNL